MLGQTLDQRYKVVSQVAVGGLATVYLGRDLKLDRAVALKVLRPERMDSAGLQRLKMEVELQAQLDHSHIVRLFDMGMGNPAYLVMQFVSGADFGAVLKQLSLPERLLVLREVTIGLAYLHARNIVHRDLKPSNILIARTGEVKLADFGLSRCLDNSVAVTREGSTVGTARYMAPEQACGQAVDHRADLYAMGVMLYECCTDRAPFVGSSQEVIAQHVHAQPEAPSKLQPKMPPKLETLILSLLAKSPDQRPASAEQVRVAIQEIGTELWPALTDGTLRESLGIHCQRAARQSRPRVADESNDVPQPVDDSISSDLSLKSETATLTMTAKPRSSSGHHKPIKPAASPASPPKSSPAMAVTASSAKRSSGSHALHSQPAVATAVIARKTPAPATKSPAAASSKSSTKRAKKSAAPSAKATAEHDAWDTDAFEELAEAEQYAPARRRRSKPKRVLPKWLTPALMLRAASSIAALVILWGIKEPFVGLLKDIGDSFKGGQTTQTGTSGNSDNGRGRESEPPEPPNGPAIVTIQTSVKGARLLIDGELQGTTPLDKTIELPAGEHRFELTFGKEKRADTVRLNAAQQLAWPAQGQDFSKGQITETGRRAVCLLRTPDGHGSGFLVQDQHTIVTAAHVIEDARSLDDLEFIFSPSADKASPNEDELNLKGAQLIHFDRAVDVAVLRLQDAVPEDRQPLLLKQERVELQVPVISVGNPGYGKGRYFPLDTASGLVTNNNPLLTTCNVKGGYSGGPVFNSQTGEVVGITSAKLVCTDIGGKNAAFIRSRLSHVFLVRKALEAWNALNPDEQTARAEQVQREWTQRVSDRRVFQAGVYLAVTSELYHMIATDTSDLWKRAYLIGGFEAANMVNQALDELRRKLKKDFNQDLEKLTDAYLKTALNDELIDAATREKLTQAHNEFKKLQSDATKLEGKLDVPVPYKGGTRPIRETTFEYRVDTAKENLDNLLKPLLKEVADPKRLDVEDFEYPRLRK